MRLSWYGDTGVAVLSIWQGDRCSGTFRLPVDELDRMVGTLRRGPDPAAEPPGAQRLDPPITRRPSTELPSLDRPSP